MLVQEGGETGIAFPAAFAATLNLQPQTQQPSGQASLRHITAIFQVYKPQLPANDCLL